ncbi:hypothetical protein ACRALDRAFT_1062285 [Sodiomyces alcalophilus JCM 7366]|uniref:uncharacterized protein n=1 Tax=Sodiomyces alcalophilus JCM 7366 TaxID=591952 RepID=UPI0039B4FC5B
MHQPICRACHPVSEGNGPGFRDTVQGRFCAAFLELNAWCCEGIGRTTGKHNAMEGLGSVGRR